MKLLIPFVMLVLSSHGAPQDPDDYFGQVEADYEYEDYYYNDDTKEDQVYPDTLKHERLIQEIDARGSNITIHDSSVDRIDARGGRLNLHSSDTIILNGGSEDDGDSSEGFSEVGEIEEVPSPEPLVATTDMPETEALPVEEALESTTSTPPVVEDLDTDLEENMVIEDGVDFENVFMERLQGLHVGMESVVMILKEIAGKVGCENGDAHSSGKITHTVDCPAPFNLVRPNDCLFLSQGNKVTWSAARKICHSLEAELVHPKLQGQRMDFVMGINDYISVAPTETVWVGASDRRQEGVWTWVNDHAASSDLPWAPGHPKNFNGREDCMTMDITHSSGLQASNCMRKKPFICQKGYVDK